MTPLEDIFDSNDILRKPKMQPLNTKIEDYNIGTAEYPKMVKLSKALPPNQKLNTLSCLKNFKMFLHGAMKTSSPMILQ